MKRIVCSVLLLFLFTVLTSALGRLVTDNQAPEVRVMTFNIRFGTAKDGINHWDNRKDFLVQTIRAFDPDLLGTQETLAFQRDYIAQRLPGYDVLGVGRDDGKEQGEMMAVFYKRDRFEKLDHGHLWLSETPELPGSRSWDSANIRMVTWVKLHDRRHHLAPPLVLFNTHFDVRSEKARVESARLLRSWIDVFANGCAVVVTGDFNTSEGSESYRILFGSLGGRPSPLVDCYRVIHPQPGPDEGTGLGFRADSTGGARIDWIACSRDWRVLNARIDRTHRDGRTPSDHFPVTAVLRR